MRDFLFCLFISFLFFFEGCEDLACLRAKGKKLKNKRKLISDYYVSSCRKQGVTG